MILINRKLLLNRMRVENNQQKIDSSKNSRNKVILLAVWRNKGADVKKKLTKVKK